MILLDNYDLVLSSSPQLIEFAHPVYETYWTTQADGWEVADTTVRAWAERLADWDWHSVRLTLGFPGIGIVQITCHITKSNASGWDTRAAVEDLAYLGYSQSMH